MTVNDANYLYERIMQIAYEMQRTRSAPRMVMSGFRAVLTAAHIPVGLDTQNLTHRQLVTKNFYEDAQSARNDVTGRGFNGTNLSPGTISRILNSPISKTQEETLLAHTVYALRYAQSATDLANANTVNNCENQIIAKLMALNISLEGVSPWEPDEDRLRALDRSYQEGR